MKKIPKAILDEAEKCGLDRMAAYLCDIDGSEIYSLGVESRENWFPCPPASPVLVSLKDGNIKPFEDFASIYRLLETT